MSGPRVFVVSDGDSLLEQALEAAHMMYTTCRVSARVDGGNASAVVAHLRGHTILLPYLRGESTKKYVWFPRDRGGFLKPLPALVELP
jgi:hypothetical protein